MNVLKFQTDNLKLDKKTWKDLDIYYIGYIDTDKPSELDLNGVNPLYLILNWVYGSISEKNGNKFLTIDKGDAVLKKIWSGVLE